MMERTMSDRGYTRGGSADLVETGQSVRLFKATLWIVAAGAVGTLGVFGILGLFSADFPLRQLMPLIGGFAFVNLLLLWPVRRGYYELAFWVFMGSLVTIVFWVMYYMGGVSGPIASALIIVPSVAGLLRGRKRLVAMALIVAVLYVLTAVAEELGVLHPWQMPATVQRLVHFAIMGVLLLVFSFVVATFSNLVQNALAAARQRSDELARANLEARQAAESERAARQREERTLWQLRRAVQEYAAFLERVSSGDHQARLDLGEMDAQDQESLRELRILGEYLNATVDTLVQALRDMQIIQRRYISESWADFVASEPDLANLSYSETGVGSGKQQWRPTMVRAMRSGEIVVQDEEMALPVSVGGVVIGVISARRERGEWGEDEIALGRAAVDQLGQTIENLRLLDQTRNAAMREQMISEVTNRMRESLELEDVLRAAASEIRQVLNLERTVVRLALPNSADGVAE
jgi:GAF domain-containing protein